MAEQKLPASSQDLRFPDWQSEFEAAIRESEPKHLRQRLEAAEGAIFLRLEALARVPGGEAEREAIAEAMRVIKTIQQQKLNYPGWERSGKKPSRSLEQTSDSRSGEE